MRSILGILALAFCSAVAAQDVGNQRDLDALLSGVTRIAAPGVPGGLCVFGDHAFAIVAGGTGGELRLPAIAAARMGKGRVVAFGHDGYFGAEALAAADTGRLMANAVRWAAGGAEKPKIAVRHQGGLLAFLKGQGLDAEALDGPDWLQKLSSCKALCLHPNSLPTDAGLATVRRFIEEGGGLIAADTGWGWLQLHPGKTLLADHAGNRLLAPAGMVWSDRMARRTDPAGFAAGAPPRFVHAGLALGALEWHDDGKLKLPPGDFAQAYWTLYVAACAVPPEDQLLLPRLRAVARSRAAAQVPTPKTPLTRKDYFARLLFMLQLRDMIELPPEQVKPHPASSAFPGAAPSDAERVERAIEVDTAIPAWHSTGLYAPPGGLITVTAPADAAGKGLSVRIGAHTDSVLDHDSWRRCPLICREFPVKAATTRAANAFGGLVYVEVPGGCKLGKIGVKIGGAVEAPHFVRGRTSLAAWRDKLRLAPAPWAELETSKVILTIPSAVVRTLDDPESLLAFWDRVLDACAELAGRPLERERPERYVTDTQISAGYMHSGYPIMTLLDVAPVIVDKKALLSNAHGGVWGLYHELGHNHQSGDWTFDGTVEVTVNLFTLYVFDTVCGRPAGSFDRVGGKNRERMLKGYFAHAPDFEGKWKSDPFLALVMYAQLQEAFGWDAYKKVFAEYRALPAGERPRSDDEKRDQWMVRFSRAVGRNLGPFFQAWGVPTSEKARASIAGLPAWMPEGFPPKTQGAGR